MWLHTTVALSSSTAGFLSNGCSDMASLKSFIAKPESFVGKTVQMSAAQIAQHPFRNYAPQSSAIQGILKGMYDSMAADLEKDNAEGADCEKAFHELMATKKAERETLETTFEKQSHDEAHKSKALSDAKTNRDDTDAQMRTDEKFFAHGRASNGENLLLQLQRCFLRGVHGKCMHRFD